MGRPVNTILQELLDEDSCRTDSTIELRLTDGETKRFSTREIIVDGATFTDELVKTGEIVQSAFSNVDRTNSQIENVDKTFGLDILAGNIDKAKVIVGRHYEDENDPMKTIWVELFSGEAKPKEVTKTDASIEVVDDLVAAGYCVASETLAPDCPLLYASPECGADPLLPPCNHNLETCRILHRFAGMESRIESASTLPDGGDGIGTGTGNGDGSTGNGRGGDDYYNYNQY